MFEQIRANKRKTAVLIILMAVFLFATGFFVAESVEPRAGIIGLLLALIVWIVLLLISYFGGDSIFLMMSGAKKIKKEDAPMLYNIVEEMIIASGLKHMPAIYIIDEPAPNAFATGRNPQKASVAVTTGLLETLNRHELQGVIAHELGHINNRDILYMTMLSAMLGSIVVLADVGRRFLFFGGSRRRSSRTSSSGGGQAQLIIFLIALVLMILAPILAQFIYFAASRQREYLADASAAQYTRYPEGLARALEKISGNTMPLQHASKATAPMYIVNPLAITKSGLSDLTSTHPPISKRVTILRTLAGTIGESGQVSYQAYNDAYKQVLHKTKGVIPSMSLAATPAVSALAATQQPDTASSLERHRDTTDMLWRMKDYIFIPCSCQTKLKIPPVYLRDTIACPHCKTEHVVKKYC